MNKPIVLETRRLFLREFVAEDLIPLHKVLGDPEISRFYPYNFDLARTENWILRNRTRYQTDGFGLWAVILKDSGELIGDCGLTLQPIQGEMLPEVGYHIRRDKQRMGYASEAASACVNWAFENHDYPAVYSYMKYTNLPSAAVAQKVGMRFLLEYPDPVNTFTRVYRITREEWEKKPLY